MGCCDKADPTDKCGCGGLRKFCATTCECSCCRGDDD